jgi:hypothetical protein
MGHIIAVTNIGNTSPLQVAKVLLQRLQGGQNLAGMERIGERIDDRDSGCLGEFYDGFMGKRADSNGIVVARQDTPEVVERLTQAHHDARILKVTGMTTELVHTHFEGSPRA